MIYQLSNQNNPKQALHMTSGAWYDILELALEYGWNPLGTVHDPWSLSPAGAWLDYEAQELGLWSGSYTGENGSLVLLDDALNLADALDHAFIDYDPEPSIRYLPGYTNGSGERNGGLRAGVGVILAVTDFCRNGAFWVERC